MAKKKKAAKKATNKKSKKRVVTKTVANAEAAAKLEKTDSLGRRAVGKTKKGKDIFEEVFRPDVEIFDERLLLPRKLISRAFGVSDDACGKWPLKPIKKRGIEVMYYLPEVVNYRLGIDGGRLDPGQEKALLDKTRREQAQLDLQKKRGGLVEIPEVIAGLNTVLSVVRQKLFTIPVKAAKDLSIEDNPKKVQAYLLEMINDLLEPMQNLEEEWRKNGRKEEIEADEKNDD